ncbi:MAG: C40 family peptidase [Bacteroidota bacterium]
MTKYGMCEQSLVPVRKTPSEQSEMINQLLFGDLITIIDSNDSWYLITTIHDSYEGWVNIKQVTIIEQTKFADLVSQTSVFLTDVYTKAISQTGNFKNILLGARLPDFKNNSFVISDGKYQFVGAVQSAKTKAAGSEIIDTSLKYIGTPYLWGGRSPFGIDCSGFTQIVFMISGINLGRDASMQVKAGDTVNFITEAAAADLAFFDNDDEKITHVGIIINNKQIIHASGEVRIDSIDHQGIYNEKQKKYTHKLRIIKRILI